MMRFAGLFAMSFALVMGVALSAEELKVERLEKLETAIPEGIRLLEAKEYVLFIKAFVAPGDFKKISDRGSIEDFAKNFGERKGPALLIVLKEIKDIKPKLEESDMKATYPVKESSSPKKAIVFKKIEKRWYIEN